MKRIKPLQSWYNNHFKFKKLFLLVVMIVFSIIIAGTVSAANIPVTPGSDAIKNAINTASDGDTLNLSDGTYNEHDIVVNKNLTITGPKTSNNNPPTAVIDAQQLGRVFTINSGVIVNLQYLTIQNGNKVTGGGIYNNGKLNVQRCSIQNNNGSKYVLGGGVYNDVNGTLTIMDSNIFNNSASFGHGAGIDNFGTLNLINSNIYNNKAPRGNGGGIFNEYSGVATLTNSNVYSNFAGNGCGIYNGHRFDSLSNLFIGILTLNGSNVFNNSLIGNGRNDGAGIFNDFGKVTMTDSNIFNNSAEHFTGGGLFNNYGTVTLKRCKIYNNLALFGGGIYNIYGPVTLTESNVYNNTALNGGGIYNADGARTNNDKSTINFINSNLYNNSASGSGGGIYSNNQNGIVNINKSNIHHNSAQVNGGGIYFVDTGILTITDSNLYLNSAPLGDGGAIYNSQHDKMVMTNSNLYKNSANNGGGIYNSLSGQITIKFCRIIGNTANLGGAIYNSAESTVGTVTAALNWWGSNSNPITKVYGTVNIKPWLILTLTATPAQIEFGETSYIKAHLIRDSNGVFHNPANGHVPDGIPMKFKTTLGTLNSPVSTTNGAANTILNSGNIKGVADVTVTADSQTIHTSVIIGPIPPRVIQIDPAMYAVNVSPYKVIKVKFSEPVKAGNMWMELKNNSGKVISITKGISSNVLTIKPNSPLINSKYILILHTGSVTDLANNPIALYTSSFTVYNSPPIVKTISPVKNAVNVPTNKLIRITFTEPVKKGNGWIELKNSSGKSIPITFNIINNVLTINHSNLAKATKYMVILHTGSVTDLIGNPVASYTSYFTTTKLDKNNGESLYFNHYLISPFFNLIIIFKKIKCSIGISENYHLDNLSHYIILTSFTNKMKKNLI